MSRHILLLPAIYPLLTFLIVLKVLKAWKAKVVPTYDHLISTPLVIYIRQPNRKGKQPRGNSHCEITISNGSFLSICIPLLSGLLASTGLSQKLPTLCLFPAFPPFLTPYSICALE
jgi:hypothetical protein